MGWTLANFIRGYQIRAECTPILRSPDAEGLYHHKCTLYMGGKEHRHMVVPYVTGNSNSIYPIEREVHRRPQLVHVSRVSTREILYNLACEAALYEIAKRPVVDAEGNRVAVEHNVDIWTALVFQDDVPLPPPEELGRLYRNTRHIAHNLRVFLEGHEAAEARRSTIYRTLISEVDEVASFVYNWTMAR